MGPIKFKTWITAVVVLFVLGVLADYYFLHLLFKEKQQQLNGSVPAAAVIRDSNSNTGAYEEQVKPTPTTGDSAPESAAENKDTFLDSLKTCAPEIAAQAIATPEALIEYLRKSIGVKSEDISVENFHLLLKDGSKRRIHVVDSDNTNSKNKKELRLFSVDAEGYPEPVPLKGTETLDSLLAMGQVEGHEVKSQLLLKDGGTVTLETHNNNVFEFQYTHQNKILSCRLKDCQCP
ncbi:hypothetical protein [Bdellovibrio svalbardensis]|uniref:Uncharacterized protein n=1 Tax=Bdellovibrio svalbardensis TaxID=2972972 RepID=A0ABT6DG81_9BACT|nr:hypothetical protein [Bdellovibrio svalbardensis]MDG0815864.1 hypothetical protein [Bdellovibrio svalbardensis]